MVLQKEIWWCSCRQGFRARTRSVPGNRLDERQRGPAEFACGGAASLAGTGEQPFGATRVEAAQEALGEARRQALAVSMAREASVASNADMVDEGQMGGEKPVASIGSPMCQAFCDVSEVKCKDLMERCLKHPEEQVPRNSGRLFLRENLWDRRSRGLSFVKEMSERPDVREMEIELCRSQSTMWLPKNGSRSKSRSECVTEELSMCCCNEDRQTQSREELRDDCVQRSEERD